MSEDKPGVKRQRVEALVGDTISKDCSISEEKTKDGSSGRESHCAICFESENLLDNHSCSTCKPRAWYICEMCDAALLSRTCPFCKEDYKE